MNTLSIAIITVSLASLVTLLFLIRAHIMQTPPKRPRNILLTLWAILAILQIYKLFADR